jgi:3-oxoacyl-[acyl-carrier-protein] synthase II
MTKRRVVVTGMGIVSPNGNTVDSFWESIKSGESGVGPITHFDATDYTVRIAAEVRNFNPEDFIERKDIRRMDPFTLYGVAAADMAIADAHFDFDAIDCDRFGALVGSGTGGLEILRTQAGQLAVTQSPRKFSPFMIPQMITDILVGHIAIKHGLRGPNFSISSACATAANSIGESFRMIQYGDADIMVAGGAEGTINELGVGGFAKMKALTSAFNDDPQRASRPFDADRSGFVTAEGAGVVVLEDYEHAVKRGAHIHCELVGYGRTCDAYHITAPHSEGRGAAKAIELSMADAGVGPADIDYINAHGTSTPLNDRGETLAIKTAFGDEAYNVAISSTKSMTGHGLGAAAGFETVACAKVLQEGIIPPTINYETPDPECDLDYTPNTARALDVKYCLNTSLGFGGHNACLCFKKYA